jgi:hypothetical protein
MRLLITAAFLLCLSISGFGQTPAQSPTPAPPANDILLIDLTAGDGQIKLGEPRKITEWVGYNNQPYFLPEGDSLLYTSIRDKQADIYRYDLKSGKTTQLTETAESEFSPTVTPDAQYFSVVRVEADGTQRLWKFPLAGGPPSLVLEKIKPVGYHTWIDANTLALFVLGQPNTLQLVDVKTEKAEVLAQNIGRTLRRVPGEDRISFVQKISDAEWLIKLVDLKTKEIVTLVKTLPGSEDYAWTMQGMLLMAKDSRMFAWDPKQGGDWREVADFSAIGLKGISRIAVSSRGDRLAIVGRLQKP